MNKIILQFGLLVFFFAIIYFIQRGHALETVFLNSLSIFILLTIMLSIIVIGLIKAINRNSLNKLEDYAEQISGNKKNE